MVESSTNYFYSKQRLAELKHSVSIDGKPVLIQTKRDPKYNVKPLETQITQSRIIPKERVIKEIRDMTHLEENFHFGIYQRDIKKQWYKFQQKEMFLIRKPTNVKTLMEFPRDKDGNIAYVEYDVYNRKIRLVGKNAGPLGRSAWVKLKEIGKKKKTRKFTMKDYVNNPNKIINDVWNKYLPQEEIERIEKIKEVAVMISDDKSIICIPDNRDADVIGIVGKVGCVTGDSLIEFPRNLKEYPKGVMIKDLVGKKDFYVYSFNIEKQRIELKKCKGVWLAKKDAGVYKVTLKSGKIIKATDNHLFLVDICEKDKSLKYPITNIVRRIKERKYIPLNQLKIGDYITTWNRCVVERGIRVDYKTKEYIPESRFIYSELFGYPAVINLIVHHKDGNPQNNMIDNLKIKGNSEHSREHTKKRGKYGIAIWKNGIHPKGMLGKKHSKKSKELIGKNGGLAKKGKPYIKKSNEKFFIDKSYCKIQDFKNKVSISKKNYFKEKFKDKRWREEFRKTCNHGRNTYSDRIVSIEFSGYEDVYDMEVEDNHNFIANEILIHNSGKTTLINSFVGRIYWKFGGKHIILNDSTNQSSEWALPNKDKFQRMDMEKVNEHPMPLPIVPLYPVLGEEKIKMVPHGFKMSLPFDEMFKNYREFSRGLEHIELSLDKSEKYFLNLKNEILDCKSIDDIKNVVKEKYQNDKKSAELMIDKINTVLDNLAEINFTDLSSGVPSRWEFDGKEIIPLIGLAEIGLVSALMTNQLKNVYSEFYPSYMQFFIDKIFYWQSKHKNNKLRIYIDEIGDTYKRGKRKSVAGHSINKLLTQGRNHNLGTSFSIQNYSMLDTEVRNNINYLFSFIYSSSDEINAIAKDWDLNKDIKKELGKLRNHECFAISREDNHPFKVYPFDGEPYETTGVFRGFALPPLSQHRLTNLK